MELCMQDGLFEMMSQDEMMNVDGGGFWGSVLIGAAIGAVVTVALAAGAGVIAPLWVAGYEVSKGTVFAGCAVGGAIAGGLGGAIKGALN